MEMMILSNGTIIDYEISKDNCKIYNSYLVRGKNTKKEFIKRLIRKYPQFKVRSIKSYYREWKSHNVLYKLGIKKIKTKDTDLCITEYWYRRLGYFIISILSIDF